MKLKFLILLVILILPIESNAVTEDDIWVPKRFTVAKHKLLSTAVETERLERCIRVVNGQMDLAKTTDDLYYFVITCRDQNNITYNVSYTYEINGVAPVLVAEQLSSVPDVASVDRQTIWLLCLNAVKAKTHMMIDVVLMEEDPTPNDTDVLNFKVPFEAKNPEGRRLRYQAKCTVSDDNKVDVKIGFRSM